MIGSNSSRLIGNKSLGDVCDFLPVLGINITTEKRHFCGLHPNVRQPLYNQMSWSLMSDSALWIVMGCMPSGPWSFEGLETVNRPVRFSGLKILCHYFMFYTSIGACIC